jgi:hypothetical protein
MTEHDRTVLDTPIPKQSDLPPLKPEHQVAGSTSTRYWDFSVETAAITAFHKVMRSCKDGQGVNRWCWLDSDGNEMGPFDTQEEALKDWKQAHK